ncbi:Cupin domain-containing protein [Neorhodopirellula lusitana]|uniref:Cupin domain-containing protein n=1 Tax=Neorhodopirellula lusitana TaxID=445327 RepID=A0ABY1Q8K2_9BACT|nr:cupin domain-containing protein [Neorhodopirellula lusitana]SMP59233.1 Cupin domain-containing protein [Neorhodopirellula lusitana]
MDIPQVISKQAAETGEMGQEYLATGKQVSMRRWEQAASEFGETHCREYETVGMLISGILELDLDGQTATLGAGDSWLVPEGAPHRYRIVEAVVAIEATSPPARFNNRDEPTSGEA